MKARIFVIWTILVMIFLSPSIAKAQNLPPLNLSLDTHSFLIRNSVGPKQFNEMVMSENEESLPLFKVMPLASREAEYHVNNYLNGEAAKCLGKFHFGFVPIPALCYQTFHQGVQMLCLSTVIGKSGCLLRFNFYML